MASETPNTNHDLAAQDASGITNELVSGISDSKEYYEYLHVELLARTMLVPQLRLLKKQDNTAAYPNADALVITNQDMFEKGIQGFQNTNNPKNPYVLLQLSNAGDVEKTKRVGHWITIILYKHNNKNYVISIDSYRKESDKPDRHALNDIEKATILSSLGDDTEFITPHTHPDLCPFYEQPDGTSCGLFSIYNTMLALGLRSYVKDIKEETKNIVDEERYSHVQFLTNRLAPEEMFSETATSAQFEDRRNRYNEETVKNNSFFEQSLIAKINDGTYKNPAPASAPQQPVTPITQPVISPTKQENTPTPKTTSPVDNNKQPEQQLSLLKRAWLNISSFMYFICACLVYAFTFGKVDWSKDEPTQKTKPEQPKPSEKKEIVPDLTNTKHQDKLKQEQKSTEISPNLGG